MLWSKRSTRLPLTSTTKWRRLSSSRACSTVGSSSSITGWRAVFWLQPATSALSDSG
jgi:hypothetical protein